MSADFLDDEMKALLSAYAAGTLSDVERKRLFAQALGDQELFDELMEAETMRAAMEGPLAKRALLNALEEEEDAGVEERPVAFRAEAVAAAAPMAARGVEKVREMRVEAKSNRRIWMALTACLAVGTVGVYTYFQRPEAKMPVVQVAQAPKPVSVDAPKAQEPPIVSAPKKSAPLETVERLARPRVEGPELAPTPQESNKAKNETARQDVSAVSVASESKKVEEVSAGIAQTLQSPPAPAPPASRPAAPAAASAKPNADVVLALRDAEKSSERKESRERSALGASRATAKDAPLARVLGRRLEIQPGVVGQLYVFLSEGSRFRRVPGLAPMPILAGGSRVFDLPDGAAGTLFVLLAPQRDAELDRLAEPHEGALPVRNWTRLNFN